MKSSTAFSDKIVFGSALASAFFIKRNSMMFGYFQQLCFGHGTHENLAFHLRFWQAIFSCFSCTVHVNCTVH
jgi:hypothetical protein